MISYNIESIDILKEKNGMYILVNGWVHSEEMPNISLYVDNKQIPVEIQWIYREDVNMTFNQNDKECRGFCIKFKYNKDKVTISYSKMNGEREFFVIDNLGKKINKYKKENSSLQYFSIFNFKRFLQYIKVWGIKKTIIKVYEKINEFQKENIEKVEVYNYNYQFKEVNIPVKWIEIQKVKPHFGIIIDLEDWKNEYESGLYSLINQTYRNYKIYFNNKDTNVKQIIDNKLKNTNIEYVYLEEYHKEDAIKYIHEDYIMKMSLYDILTTTALAHIVESININLTPEIIISDYDNFEKEDLYFTRIRKNKILYDRITTNIVIRGAWAIKNKHDNIFDIESVVTKRLDSIEPNKLCHIDRVILHRRIIKDDAEPNSRVKTIAFYLPQFHCFPENDQWWGKGFTEWVNVKRAVPMFQNHNQPRLPGDLGYYDLMNEIDLQSKQIELAKMHNVNGFCYYYYWFNGKRLLEKPLNKMLDNKAIDFPFCICWANENWTRRWDGLQHEILMEQVHEQDSDERFIRDLIEVIRDERYIRIDNKPLILIYKVDLLKDGKSTIIKWREEVKKYGIEGIYVAIVKQPGVKSASQYNADAMVEFPPHDMNAKEITSLIETKNDFTGHIFDYSELANRDIEQYNYTLFRSCMLQWDNTARRMGNANIFENFTPEDYKRWLLRNKEYEILFNPQNERFMFINAWNEWAEGTYLEPDEKYGDKFLKITKQIVESR